MKGRTVREGGVKEWRGWETNSPDHISGYGFAYGHHRLATYSVGSWLRSTTVYKGSWAGLCADPWPD